MTRTEQETLLTNFFDQVRDALLKNSDKWPEDWDGFELRWLALEAMRYEDPVTMRDRRGARRREFEKTYLRERLY